jgi:hypothetical protein
MNQIENNTNKVKDNRVMDMIRLLGVTPESRARCLVCGTIGLRKLMVLLNLKQRTLVGR